MKKKIKNSDDVDYDYSVASLPSLKSETFKELLQAVPTKKTLLFQLSRLTVTMTMPLVAVAGFAILMFVESQNTNEAAKIAEGDVAKQINIAALIENLERERFLTALSLLSKRDSKNVGNEIMLTRQSTENSAKQVTYRENDKFVTFINQTFPDSSSFNLYIRLVRSKLDSNVYSLDHFIDIYTTIIKALTDWAITIVHLPDIDGLKRDLLSINSLMMATENLGLQTCLASEFFFTCRIHARKEKDFVMLHGSAEAFLEIAFRHHELTNKFYNDSLIDINMTDYKIMKSCVLKEECTRTCLAASAEKRRETGMKWYFASTKYINALYFIRTTLELHLYKHLDDLKSVTIRNIVISVFVMFGVSVGCICLTTWNVHGLKKLSNSVSSFAKDLTEKSEHLLYEQKRVKELLTRMLPKQTAEQLIQRGTVDAEFYDCVSICFSDIVGFTEFSSSVTPFAVVGMLNELFWVFDLILENYDVYKVSTIGDAYMTVSGVPVRNGMRHVTEICKFALEILDRMAAFSVPRLTDKLIKIRIGIHTGTCVAGVVGIKRPSYCLFGSSVEIAAMMESTGQAQKIQISQATNEALENVGGFATEPHTEMEVKGIGKMSTYWLLSGK